MTSKVNIGDVKDHECLEILILTHGTQGSNIIRLISEIVNK